MELSEWTPIVAVDYIAEVAGTVLTAQDWNNRLLLTILQGNDSQEVLTELVEKHLELRAAYDDLVNGELSLILPGAIAFESVYGIQTAIDLAVSTYAGTVTSALAGKSETGHTHAQAAVTDLVTRLSAMDEAIALAQTPAAPSAHSVLTGRDATGSHPIAAITDLATALSGKQKSITVSTAAPSGGTNGDLWVQYA